MYFSSSDLDENRDVADDRLLPAGRPVDGDSLSGPSAPHRLVPHLLALFVGFQSIQHDEFENQATSHPRLGISSQVCRNSMLF